MTCVPPLSLNVVVGPMLLDSCMSLSIGVELDAALDLGKDHGEDLMHNNEMAPVLHATPCAQEELDKFHKLDKSKSSS